MTPDLNASYVAFSIPHHRLTPSRDVIDDKRVVDYGRGEITNARSIEGCDNRLSNYARRGRLLEPVSTRQQRRIAISS